MNCPRTALDGLGGIPAFKGWPVGFSQSTADARWFEIGAPLPAPIVPASMIGWTSGAGRDAISLYKVGDAAGRNILKNTRRGATKEERNFLNFWGKVAIDPYRKQGGISKVAGGILKVASIALPAFALAESATSAGNVGLQLTRAKGDTNLANRVMSPELAAQDAADAKVFKLQLDQLNALAPMKITREKSPAVVAQEAFAAIKKVPLAPVSAASNYLPWLLFAGFAAAALLVLRR